MVCTFYVVRNIVAINVVALQCLPPQYHKTLIRGRIGNEAGACPNILSDRLHVLL